MFDTSNDFYGRQLEALREKYEPSCVRRSSALVDYVKQGNSAFDCQGIRGGSSSAATLPVISLLISLARHCSAQICVTPM
jgi:hypothetical protein